MNLEVISSASFGCEFSSRMTGGWLAARRALRIVNGSSDRSARVKKAVDVMARAVPGALGYHDVMKKNGTPYARVFVNTILANKGTWLRGANSISCTVSHEACELVGDPTANHWVQNLGGARTHGIGSPRRGGSLRPGHVLGFGRER
jgi:hypothetical protein